MKSTQMKLRLHFLIAMLGLFIGTHSSAQTEIHVKKSEVRADRESIRQDRRELREDRRELREDRRELREDKRDIRTDVAERQPKKQKKSCDSLIRQELQQEVMIWINQIQDDYKSCCNPRGCRNTNRIEKGIGAAAAFLGGGTGYALHLAEAAESAPARTKAALVAAGLGVTAIAALATFLTTDPKCSPEKLQRMTRALDKYKAIILAKETPIAALREVCSSPDPFGNIDRLAISLIKSGQRFFIAMECDNGDIDMGTIMCRERYTGQYDQSSKKWTFTGKNKNTGTENTASYDDCGSPDKRQICIWGRGFKFNKKLIVVDNVYGKVGSILFDVTAESK